MSNADQNSNVDPGAKTAKKDPTPEPMPVFYKEGICIHRNELTVTTHVGPRKLRACKVLTVSPSYMGSVEGLVDLLNIGWEVMARMEATRATNNVDSEH